jgi:hypothetical protein
MAGFARKNDIIVSVANRFVLYDPTFTGISLGLESSYSARKINFFKNIGCFIVK